MPEHFDVIIIGTGAGGGTLAHTLASSGKRILLLEREDFLPREMENWSPDEVFIDGRYISKDTWYDSDGNAFQPQVHYFVGGATKLYGAALYRLRPEDFGEIQHVDGVSPAWPVGYDEFEPSPRPRRSTRSTAPMGEDPTEGHYSAPYSRSPRAEPRTAPPGDLPTDLEGQGVPPVLGPMRHPARRVRSRQEPLHPLRMVRRLSLPGPRQGRRRSHGRPAQSRVAERRPADQRHGDKARDRPDRPDRHRRRGGARRDPGGVPGRHRRGGGRRVQQRQAALELGQRHPSHRVGQRLGSGRPQLTISSTTARPSSRWARSPTTPCSRRRSASTTSTLPVGTASGPSGTSRWSASPMPAP